MTHRRWWWGAMMGLCMLMGTLGACSGGNGDGDHGGNGCVLFAEVEPNDTEVHAQDLDTVFFGDCVVVDGSIFTAVDEDSYRVFIQEDLTLVVTLDHSSLVDFDVLLFDADTGQLIRDCGTGVVPELCVVAFDVIAGDIAIDVVVVSASGAGTYTLELSAE